MSSIPVETRKVPEADIPGVFSENQLGISDAVEFDTMEAAFASMLAGNAILFVSKISLSR